MRCCQVVTIRTKPSIALNLLYFITSKQNAPSGNAVCAQGRTRGITGDQTQAAYFRATYFIREVIITTLTLTTIDRFQ